VKVIGIRPDPDDSIVPVSEEYPFPVTVIDAPSGTFKYARTTANLLVKTGAGVLHSITISQNDAAPTAGDITVYDNTTNAAPIIFFHTQTTAVFMPINIVLDVEFIAGLYVAFGTTADVSVTLAYR
jgi:hypothetical protein